MEALSVWRVAALASTVAYLKHHVVFLQNSLIKFINVPVQILTLYFLWLSLSANGIKDFNPQTLLIYNILSFCIRWLFNFRGVAQEYEKAIYEGGLVNAIVRPLPLSAVEFGRVAARIAVNLIVLVVILTPLAVFNAVRFDLPAVASFLVLLLLGSWIQFLIYALLGLLSFWVEKIFGIVYAFDLTLLLTSGTLLPLTIYPPAIMNVLTQLPFRFFAFTPIQALTARPEASWIIAEILSASGWIAALSLMHLWLFRAGLKRFTGMGV